MAKGKNGYKPCGQATRKGTKCKLPALENGRCMWHGGKNKPGVDHPAIKHGLSAGKGKTMLIPGARKSSALPPRFYDNVMAASEDPNLSSLHDEIIMVDVRISDLTERVDTGESGEMWMQLRELSERYKRESDPDAKYLMLEEIFTKIYQGSTDHQTWLDINMNIEQKARLIRAETTRMKELDMLMRTDRVLLFIRAVIEVVMRNVPDPDQQERIRRAVERLLDLPDINFEGGIT